MKADSNSRVDPALAERLYRQAKAERWRVPQAAFTAALETSCAKAFPAAGAAPREVSRYLSSLHLEDLALACACALGDSAAWDHFVLEMRPGLYRAADALDRSGAARELADSLYADLYGVDQRGGTRQSLLRYFHGRSSLATWLRAVLAQRHVDRVRVDRRTEPLPEELPGRASPAAADPDCVRFVEMLRSALETALARLEPRDRLRLGCYYAQQLTLAKTGTLLKEHEATTSRQLARTRQGIRAAVEEDLRARGLNDAQIARCFECATEDVGTTNLDEMLDVRSLTAVQVSDGPALARNRDRIVLYEERTNGPRTRTGRLAGHHAAAIAVGGVRRLPRRRDAGGLGRRRAERQGRRGRRAACVELLALHGGACRDGAHGSRAISHARLDAGAPVPLARAARGRRDSRRDLGCRAGSADDAGAAGART